MADGENKITIGIEAEVGQLVSGLKKAEAELKQAGKRLEAIAAQNGAKAGKAMGESYAKEAAAAQRRIAASRSAVFGGNTGAAGAADPASEILARRANVLIGLQAVTGALRVVDAISHAIRGEWDKVQESMDQIPLGIGLMNRTLRETLYDIVGITGEMESLATLNKDLDRKYAELTATKPARDSARDELLGLRAASGAAGAGNPADRERILVAEARRKAEAERAAMERAGVDPETAAEIFALKLRQETEQISKAIADEFNRSQLARIRKQLDMEMGDAAMRAKIERDAAEKANAARAAALADEIKTRTEAEDAMRSELSKAQSVTGDNFVRSIGTAFGEFKFAQNGAAQAVARAQIRATELLGDINENTKQLVILNKERDGILSLR